MGLGKELQRIEAFSDGVFATRGQGIIGVEPSGQIVEGLPLRQWLTVADDHIHAISDGRAC
jgi:hypothetical protein